MTVMLKGRELADLVSIGPAMLRDFEMLGVKSVAQLAREEPEDLYKRLCLITGQRQDPCVLDVFCAAVAQARNPELPPAKCQWWYWSRERKRAAAREQKRSPRRSEG
jgi:Pathogenicity locus